MISGILTDTHATVALTFLLPNGSTVSIEFVIDTGFTGELCLPLEAVSLMGLTFRHDTFANLADIAQDRTLRTYNGEDEMTKKTKNASPL